MHRGAGAAEGGGGIGGACGKGVSGSIWEESNHIRNHGDGRSEDFGIASSTWNRLCATAVSAVSADGGAFVCHGRVGRAFQRYSMRVTPVYRKTKRTYNDPGHAHFLTCSCYQRWPLLSKDRSRLWVIESLQQLREKF